MATIRFVDVTSVKTFSGGNLRSWSNRISLHQNPKTDTKISGKSHCDAAFLQYFWQLKINSKSIRARFGSITCGLLWCKATVTVTFPPRKRTNSYLNREYAPSKRIVWISKKKKKSFVWTFFCQDRESLRQTVAEAIGVLLQRSWKGNLLNALQCEKGATSCLAHKVKNSGIPCFTGIAEQLKIFARKFTKREIRRARNNRDRRPSSVFLQWQKSVWGLESIFFTNVDLLGSFVFDLDVICILTGKQQCENFLAQQFWRHCSLTRVSSYCVCVRLHSRDCSRNISFPSPKHWWRNCNRCPLLPGHNNLQAGRRMWQTRRQSRAAECCVNAVWRPLPTMGGVWLSNFSFMVGSFARFSSHKFADTFLC